MTIKPEYFDYLNHFGETVCLKDYRETDNNVIALRHDIDYCIDTAHPIIPEKNWKQLSSFEKCCQYVAFTNKQLTDVCSNKIRFREELCLLF